jgi:DNA-binding response OmpR family regulator
MKLLRVLIVEDDALLGIYLGEMLVAMGYEVCAIEATEAKAVSAAFEHRPDLMIVDARLREGSGVGAIKQIINILPIPYLFVSGDLSGVEAAKPGAVVIRKPFREAELAWAIQRALGAAVSS